MAETTPADPPSSPLVVLHAMVNAVLIQTGRVFREIPDRDPQNLQHINKSMNEIIPGSTARFQAALDVIEMEIVQAKAAFERELAQSRAKKEAERKASEQAVTSNAQERTGKFMRNAVDQTLDIDMTDVSPVEQSAPKQAKPQSAAAPSLAASARAANKLTQDQPRTMSSQIPLPKVNTTSSPANTFIQTDETPTTAGLGKGDLESMFPSISEDVGSGAGDLDFMIDFSADSAADTGLLSNDFGIGTGEVLPTESGAAKTSIDFSNALDSRTTTALALPNDGGGLSTIIPEAAPFTTANQPDLVVLDLTTTGQSTAMDGNAGTGGIAADDLITAESNFDDLFFDQTFDMNGGGGLGDAGELDNSFFEINEDSKKM
ncbi:MAG: hypothetical protein M1814_004494 [Vezdaea aestivalis]|nr:MAG: hypothetical protein M1814_004494 [Vezdaea aestivalis]